MAQIPESILSSDRQVIGAREALMHICSSLSAGLECASTGLSARDLLRDLANSLRSRSTQVGDDDSVYSKVCGEILDILKAGLDGPPLLIVLDQLEKIFGDDLHRIISDKLIWPIACNRLDNVYVIATVGEEALKDSILGGVATKWEWAARVAQIEIDFFQPGQAMPLGREYGARKGWVAEPEWQSWISNNPRMQQAWPPVELVRLAEAYEKYGRSK
jgi:hypothetical protein